MKKVIALIFILLSASFNWVESSNDQEPLSLSVAQQAMYIEGNSTLSFSGGSAGASYSLYYAPSNAVCEWSIVGTGRAYCYPNGDYCSINVYAPGTYRLVCDVYVNGVRIDGVTKYITVMGN